MDCLTHCPPPPKATWKAAIHFPLMALLPCIVPLNETRSAVHARNPSVPHFLFCVKKKWDNEQIRG